jgi:gliding motility-associated-like protein
MRNLKVLTGILMLCLFGQFSFAQAIFINEYSAANQTAVNDNYGQTPDWVEIYSGHTFSLNLSNYYLSNDSTNLLKWRFPANYTIAPNSHRTIWLSGRNEVTNGNVHANFTLQQCKGQVLFLVDNSSSGRVIRDRVKIKMHESNHTVARQNDGSIIWNIFINQTSFGLSNTIFPIADKYIDYSPMPVFAKPAGWYPGNLTQMDITLVPTNTLGILGDFTNYEVWYTLDGSLPLPSAPTSSLYTFTNTALPIVVFPGNGGVLTEMWRARTFAKPASGLKMLPSFCETNTYFGEPDDQIISDRFAVLSVAIDTTFFNIPTANLIGHTEYFENKQLITEGYSSFGRQDFELWSRQQKGFTINIDDERGFGCGFEYQLFNDPGLGVSTRTSFPTIQVKAGDYESYSKINGNAADPTTTGIRDLFAQTYAIKNNLDVNGLHAKPIILFINGKYRGIHYIMENYDVYYDNYYKKQPIDKQDLLKHHFISGVEAGTLNNSWTVNTYSFITTFPMKSTTNYSTASSRLDMKSFTDYMIYNNFMLNADLFQYNVAFGRGLDATKPGNKYHYWLWNTPNIFGLNANTYVPDPYFNNQGPLTSPCDFVQQYNNVPPSTFTSSAFSTLGHPKMLQYLLGSPSYSINFSPKFREDYINRYQDLINGPFRCDRLLEHLKYIKDLYKLEIVRHELRYGITPTTPLGANTFEYNVDTLLGKPMTKRCENVLGLFKQNGCFGLVGPYNLIVKVEPEGAGKVRINTIAPDNYDFSAQYYKGPMYLKAIPKDTQYVFDHWEFKVHAPANGRAVTHDSIALGLQNNFGFQADDEIIAVFTDKKSDIALPTGFTPNADGINDIFAPLGPARFSKEFEFRIWNRWGQEVFRSGEPTKGWDGTFENSPAQTGVYAYLITYKDAYSESKILKGNVTLIR